MKKIFVLIILLGSLASCGGSGNEIKAVNGDVTSNVASNRESDAELAEQMKQFDKEEKKRAEEEEKTMTSISFDRLRHDFGDVAQGSENTTRFNVTNTGERPLIISDVSASCGCTLPVKPEGPIAPGASDVIEVTFKPKPGQQNEIEKTVTVVANTKEKVSMLKIRAFVTE